MRKHNFFVQPFYFVYLIFRYFFTVILTLAVLFLAVVLIGSIAKVGGF